MAAEPKLRTSLPRPSSAEGPGPASTSYPLVIGGYRIVRRLGGGSTATVLLARGAGRSVALRRYRDVVDDARIDAEIEALGRARSRHLVTLLDLATGPDGRPVPILDAVIGPRLDELLLARAGVLEPGEAVTVLVPLAELLHELHEVGVTVGRWDSAGVRVGADGAPVLTALSGMTASPPLPERFRRSEPGVIADLASLRSLGERVVAAVQPDRRDALREAVAMIAEPHDLERALFDAARPTPLVLDLQASAATGTTATSPATPATPTVNAKTVERERFVDRMGAVILRVLHDLGLPEGVIAPLRSSGLRLGRQSRSTGGKHPRPRTERRRGAGRPRRSVVLVGAAGLIAFVGAAILVTTGDGGSGSAAPEVWSSSFPSNTPASHGPDGGSAVETTGVAEVTSPTPSEIEPPTSATTPDTAAVDAGAVIDVGSEPRPAEWQALVEELAHRWVLCRRAITSGAGQPECGGTVVQPGSAAEESLRHPEPVVADSVLRSPLGEVVVVDRLGSAALLDLVSPAGTPTASLLVMRSEAGWRIRSILD